MTTPVQAVVPLLHKGLRGYQSAVSGLWLPGVNTVLDVLIGPSEYLDAEAAQEGTRQHEEVAVQLKRWASISEADLDQMTPRVRTLIEWLHAEGFEPLEVEQPRESYLGYAGTPDALLVRRGQYYVPDWKFSEVLTRRNEVQLEANGHLFSLLHLHRLLVKIPKDRPIVAKPIPENPSHWSAFVSALQVLRWRLMQ